MNIEVDLGQAGKVVISDIKIKNISFTDFNDVKDLFYNLNYRELRDLVLDFLNSVSESEFKQIISQADHKV